MAKSLDDALGILKMLVKISMFKGLSDKARPWRWEIDQVRMCAREEGRGGR